MANSRSLSQQASGEKSVETPSFDVEWENGIKDLEDFLEYERKKRLEIEDEVRRARLSYAEEIATKMARIEAENGKMSNAQKLAFLKAEEKEKLKSQSKTAAASWENKATAKQTKKDEKEIEQLKKLAELQEKLVEAEENQDEEAAKAAQDQIDAIKKQQLKEENHAKLQQNLLKGLGNAIDAMGNEINSMISSFASYQSAINTRLEGTGESFNSLRKGIIMKMGSSPFVKTQKVLESLQTLVAEGIGYNLEQRTFLASLSDKIATTFEVANESLLKIVKIQQADTTAARLGMESYLTRYLNASFQNTEYLSKNFDNVTASLLDASATMKADKAVEFEFAVQKWLGALSSVGLTDNTVSSLAQAIGWLGTGDVNSLTSSPLNNLIVMAANKAGLDYSEILINGLDTNTTNKLLEAAVEYLQSIAKNNNKVVRTQLASTFGVSSTDLMALTNLSSEVIDSIAAEQMTYKNTVDELSYQFSKLSSRVSVPEMLQNLIENFKFTTASTIAGNPVTATMWALTDMIQKYTGGINIPAFQTLAMGTGGGFDLNATVEGLIKTGMIGLGALGGLGSIVAGIAGAAAPTLLLRSFGINANLETRELTPTRGLYQSVVETSDTPNAPETGSGADGGEGTLDEETKKAEDKQKENERAKAESLKEKALSDIYFYLMDFLDPKLNAMVQMTASMAGFGFKRTSWDRRASDEDRWEFNYGTTVSVVEGGGEGKTQLGVLEELNNTVLEIYKLLDTRMVSPLPVVNSMTSDWPGGTL